MDSFLGPDGKKEEKRRKKGALVYFLLLLLPLLREYIFILFFYCLFHVRGWVPVSVARRTGILAVFSACAEKWDGAKESVPAVGGVDGSRRLLLADSFFFSSIINSRGFQL